MALNNLQSELRAAIETILNKKTEAYDTTGTVVRVEEGTAWVHLPGGVDETPVNLTVDAKEGDTVQIRVGGGSAWIVGNHTSPPTDDRVAIAARTVATQAQESAITAVTEATEAKVTANTAKESADGKSTIYRQADAPTGGTYKSGDTWFDTDDGNKIYSWDGTEWVPGLIGTSAIDDAAITNAKISNLDAGKITTGKLAAARIDVDDLFAQNINATGTISGVTITGASGKFTKDFEVEFSKAVSTKLNTYRIYAGSGTFDFQTTFLGPEEDEEREILGVSKLSINENGFDFEKQTGFGTGAIVNNMSFNSGNMILGNYSKTGALYVRLVTDARSVELFNYETSGNVGLYDRGNSSWILYSASNQRVCVPHNFTIGSTSLNGVNMQFVSGTRNGGINLSSADNFGLFDNTNNSWIIRSSGGQASGESVGDVFIPHPLIVGGKLTAPNIVHGRVQITPTAVNTPTSAAVTWPNMGGTPNIALGANTVVPGTQIKGVGFSGASATGCTIWLTRDTNLTAVWVHYIAVY